MVTLDVDFRTIVYTAIVVAQETLRETKSFPSSTLPHMHLHHSEKLQRKMSFSSTLFRKTKSSIKLLRDKKSECWNANSTLWCECQLYAVIWMPTLHCDVNANSTLWSECQLYAVIWMPTLHCDLNANSTLWFECQLSLICIHHRLSCLHALCQLCRMWSWPTDVYSQPLTHASCLSSHRMDSNWLLITFYPISRWTLNVETIGSCLINTCTQIIILIYKAWPGLYIWHAGWYNFFAMDKVCIL